MVKILYILKTAIRIIDVDVVTTVMHKHATAATAHDIQNVLNMPIV